jgi:hypothetical protein
MRHQALRASLIVLWFARDRRPENQNSVHCMNEKRLNCRRRMLRAGARDYSVGYGTV